MDREAFLEKHRRLVHLAHADSWPSIERHGLLSTEEIVRCWDVPASQHDAILRRRRIRSFTLEHPELGRAVVRDQLPLNEAGLRTALAGSGMSVGEWLELLNSMVFFFPSVEAAATLRAAYAREPAVLITVNARTLLREHESRLRLATFNTGYTLRRPKPRGPDSFMPLRRYERTQGAVREVTVLSGVPDLSSHLIEVEHLPAQR
jgi:hypothetical protein